jgi:DUF1680 family protein
MTKKYSSAGQPFQVKYATRISMAIVNYQQPVSLHFSAIRRNGEVLRPKVVLGGWEAYKVELRGHTTGHMLSALSLMYASTGNGIYRIKSDSLAAGLAGVQRVLNRDGQLGV